MEENAQEILPRAIGQMPREIYEYFLCFSLFEKCLKSRGEKYLAINVDGEFRIKHCDFFSEALHDDNTLSAQIMAISHAIRLKPPGKQIIVGGRVDFKRPHGGTMNATRVLEALPRIRNNLFHGGKWPSGPEEESARDRSLLREATDILLLVLDCCASSEDPDLAEVGMEFRHGLVRLAAD